MKIKARILLIVGCLLLLGTSWLLALTGKSDAEKQKELIERAEAYLADDIYVYSVPLLEEAAAYDAEYTPYVEEKLKEIYTHELSKGDYRSKYEQLLDKQMARENAGVELFSEVAEYYLAKPDFAMGLAVLKDGIARTGGEELTKLYESVRYAYSMNVTDYEDVTAPFQGAIQVMRGGKWGVATASGGQILPCEYDSVSTWGGDRFIVLKDGVISAVNGANERIALFHGEADGFSNLAQDRLAFLTDGAYVLANGSFGISGISFEELGMYSDGYAAAKADGKWGLVAVDGTTWLFGPSYDGIVTDELGRSFCQNAVFVRQADGTVTLLAEGRQIGTYEDARPFADGWAAVKSSGKWGFIDTDGNVKIDFRFEDARSFGQHLAAVKQDSLWGYVSLQGEMAIEPAFLDARSFSGGSAAVKTEDGWQFITLLEYGEG